MGKDALSAEVLEAVKRHGLALKTKLLPPAEGTKVPVNYNVNFRRALGLFASVRPDSQRCRAAVALQRREPDFGS